MSGNNYSPRTTLKTIRMSTDQAEVIERTAREEGVTFNSVINKMVGNFVEFDRFAEKLDFVSAPREVMRSLVEAIDDETLERMANALGARVPREMILFRHKKEGIAVFLRYLGEVSKYHRFGKIEMSVEDGNVVVFFHHDMGSKWSIFLKGYLSQAAKTFVGILPVCEVGQDGLILKLKSSPEGRLRAADVFGSEPRR